MEILAAQGQMLLMDFALLSDCKLPKVAQQTRLVPPPKLTCRS